MLRFACLALLLARLSTAQSLTGEWIGYLGEGAIREGVVCIFESHDGILGGTLMGGLGGARYSLDHLKLEGTKVHFQIQAVEGTFDGLLTNKKLTGTWTQRGMSHPLQLEPSDRDLGKFLTNEAVEMFVRKKPQAVHMNGRLLLLYELHITNWSNIPLRMRRLDLIFGDGEASIGPEALETIAVAGGTKLGPWGRSVLLLQASADSFPTSVRHKLTFERRGEEGHAESVEFPISSTAVKLAPPLSGGTWTARNGPDSSRHHRAALTMTQGELFLSQRFAFDFTLQGGAEKLFDNQSHRSYGAPVFAVADATVESVSDQFPDNIVGDLLPLSPVDQTNMCGNQITLRLNTGEYVTYCHLQAQLRVKNGDQVHTGQFLGLVGNSGSSSGPHLHFEVTDGRNWIDSEGIPFEFTSFVSAGKTVNGEMPHSEQEIVFPVIQRRQ